MTFLIEVKENFSSVWFSKNLKSRVWETYQNRRKFIHFCPGFYAETQWISLLLFLMYFYTAHRMKLSKITKKITNKQKNAKNRQKRPFLTVFRCFQVFLRYCSKTALTIFFILPGGEALHTGYLRLYVLYLKKFLFFCSFLAKTPKLGHFSCFSTFWNSF